MSSALEAAIGAGIARKVASEVQDFAASLAAPGDVLAVLFYGSNLRTESLEGVLDYYVLGSGAPERGIWPHVSYHEWEDRGQTLRAKVATMTLAKFAAAASGTLSDTTIWTRFAQPSALVWQRDTEAAATTIAAIAAASVTAARLAVALGPETGRPADYWTALFEATYRAEFRIEKVGRAQSIFELNRAHFDRILPLALDAAGIACENRGDMIAPRMEPRERARILRWWMRRRVLGKPINLVRLIHAASTFDGAARYATWKIQRHSGVQVELTPWRERHPVLAAPSVLWSVWHQRRRQKR